jgi:hypothetical protein
VRVMRSTRTGSNWGIRAVLAALLIGALGAVGAVGAAPAWAGTYEVTINPTVNCGLLSYWGDARLDLGCPDFGGDISVGNFPQSAAVPSGTRGGWQITAPPGLSLVVAEVSLGEIGAVNSGAGWGGGSFWANGGNRWSFGMQNPFYEGPFNSSYYGFQVVCGASSCPGGGNISVGSLNVWVSESTGPAISAPGSNNLWNQSGRYVWNPPADSFPLSLVGSDVSGVCSLSALVDSVALNGPSWSPVTTSFQQCPEPTWTPAQGAQVDTRSFVPTAGPLPVVISATNAAGVISQLSQTLEVDNDPVSVSLAAVNDPNPTVWVNHAVTVLARASAGPSGVGGMNCSANGAPAHAYSSSGVVVNGDGVRTVSCTGWNRAVDPQGAPATGTRSLAVHIDEAPPTLSFEPVDPSNPDAVVIDTHDSESGVVGGSIAIAPTSTQNWTSLPTSFDGQHLLGQLNDAGLTGPYTIQATSCDQVGNCASTSQQLTLPLRLATASAVSFQTIVNPLKVKKITKRVRVGWHYATRHRHGKRVRVRVGGHLKKITIIKYVEHCSRQRVRTGKHHWRIRKVCKQPHLKLQRTKRVTWGKPFTVHGLITTAQGVPLTGAPVQILTAPANGHNAFTPAASAQTDAAGHWTATLPAGPSRIIRAAYPGSATMLPASGQATATVRAHLRISITPRIVPWGAVIRITGHLLGGYVPTNSKLLRLNVGIGRIGHIEGLPDIHRNGRFQILWKFDAGAGIAHPWFAVATLLEAAFPYSPASSNRVTITLGKRTPRARHHKTRHHKTHETRHRKAKRR